MRFFTVQKTSESKTVTFGRISIKLRRTRVSQKRKKHLYKIPFFLKKNGCSLIANFKNNSGESKVARSVLEALQKSTIPCDYFELTEMKEPKFKTKITFTTSPYYKPEPYRNISVLYWEFESGMPEVRPYVFDEISGVITFSDFCQKYFKEISKENIPIFKLPYPLNINKKSLVSSEIIKNRYNLNKDDFVCFFNFSYASSYFRKNPEAVLEAFRKAFSGKINAKLLIKTSGAILFPVQNQRLNKCIEKMNLREYVTIINDDLTDVQMHSLLNCCDVYISLHRGEGIGLGLLEAMALEKPVVATNYGGNTDFTKEGLSFPVSYKLVAPQKEQQDLSAYKYVQNWAEPNIDEAAEYLRLLYEDPSLRRSVGQKAEEYVSQKYSIERFVEKINEILVVTNGKRSF